MKMNDLVHNEERLKQLRERAKELIGQMTLEEKVYQTLYNACLLYTSDAADE